MHGKTWCAGSWYWLRRFDLNITKEGIIFLVTVLIAVRRAQKRKSHQKRFKKIFVTTLEMEESDQDGTARFLDISRFPNTPLDLVRTSQGDAAVIWRPDPAMDPASTAAASVDKSSNSASILSPNPPSDPMKYVEREESSHKIDI